MEEKDLDTLFNEAFQRASDMTQVLPPDVMLRIYAYYKQATGNTTGVNPHPTHNLREAFKLNAWMQVRHLTPNEAKKLYIETINSLIK
ncbi:phosphatidylserine decarboxylase [Flavobacterium akiainvivens]|uniref:Phosphatidylserine decarboxylase n=1 Tax=Flavobacterium akiainvivens TaxID=1202724 RepID=A0A0M8M8H3_9FLAO|nr:acyl-CoA-binding protein [Flavobacterium akiainvivens]KOS04715.1 phosphatidylserine decarboxylase [Flavobacterium akiainvivens]SFQ67131.1 Acyl-CoA-binding protein [Flavobacterium akiainvivens]